VCDSSRPSKFADFQEEPERRTTKSSIFAYSQNRDFWSQLRPSMPPFAIARPHNQ
jgi:hypothetical protein